jgi:pyruvate dehydrogenase E2 component (dihydrolipoamide acetyltransferase)
MPTDVILPKVDMVMESGTIVRWYHAEGETVAAGEPLLEIETDKSTIDVEAPASGALAAISAHPGDTVPVAARIALILAPGETTPTPHGAPAPTPHGGGLQPASRAPTNAPGFSPERFSPDRPRASPVARALARNHGLDLWQIAGSGPQGRVVKDDVLKQLERQATAQPAGGAAIAAPTAIPATSGVSAHVPAPTPVPPNGAQPHIGGSLIPLSGVRRVIAERLAVSANIPSFTISIDVTMSEALALRERLPYRPSITAIIARAVAPILMRHPDLNSSFHPEGIWRHNAVHLGIALDNAGRLLVPVIRDADRLSLRELHTALGTLRERAAAHKLGPAELQGSTFSLSNLGMFGVDTFTALINPPEAAILAVGRTAERWVGDGPTPERRPMLTLTISVDHRVADGATAARFLAELRAALEEPYLLL